MHDKMLALKRPRTRNTDRRRSNSYSSDGAAVSTSRNYNTPQSDCQAGYVMLGQGHQSFYLAVDSFCWVE